jgi:uncharacterized membrane protein
MNLFAQTAHWIATGIEIVGIFIIVIGAVIASALFLVELKKEKVFPRAYQKYRQRLGQGILLGLEFLVAADIIGTVAVDPTFRNVGVLAVIVGLRTFLSFALEIEIKGRLPWKEGPGSKGRDDPDTREAF